MSDGPASRPMRVVVAGATGYLGRFVAHEFKRRGHFVRVLTRSRERLEQPGPFGAPSVRVGDADGTGDVDEVFVGEVTQPETLEGLFDGDIDLLYSSVAISRQRDGLSFEQVDYQANRNLIDAALAHGVRKVVYVSMLGADQIGQLAITQAHERIVRELEESPLEHCIIRPSGFFSDMGVVLDMANRGRVLLVGDGTNLFNPIYGGDLAKVCVDGAEGDAREIEAGGPDSLSQLEVAELAFDVVGKPCKVTRIPMWLAKGVARFVGLLNTQFGDLAEFIVTAGEVDALAPALGTTTLRSYFEKLQSERT